MRTTTTAALLASMLALGCVPIGSDEPNRTLTKPDAGSGNTADTTCDTSNITSKSGDFDFTSSASLTGLPTSCWTLAGKLTVDSSISSLAKLGDLRGVQDLVITNTGLTSIDTPNPLAVSGSVDIEMNSKLTDLTNLSLPTDSTCGSFLTAVTLSGNSALTSMGAMNQVRCVIGAAAITNNTKLTDIDFSNAVRLEGGLTVSGNTAATTLELTALTSITSGLTIQNNTALTSLGTWTALQFMHGGLTIDTNPAVTSLAGVITASANGSVGTGIMIEGALAITNNAKLADVGDFDHLSWAESINVSNNAALTYCTARSVGCCVVDSAPTNVQMASITANATTNCNGASSWCYGPDNNHCHNEYTGYNGGIE